MKDNNLRIIVETRANALGDRRRPACMIGIYITVFCVALLMPLLFTPAFIRFAVRHGVVDSPGPRRVNVRVMPRLGGPALLLGFLVATALVHRRIDVWPGLIAGALIVFAVGAVDDVKHLRPALKLVGHIVAAIIAYKSGIRIEFLSNPAGGGMYHLPLWVSFFLTVFWIIGITNAVNLIDGLDGLAAGIVCIAALTFFLVAVQKGLVESALLAVALAGTTGGFLRWNFYKAKTFMGDSGAYFLGYTAAVIAIIGAFKSTTALTLLIPVFALGVPIFDTSFAIVRRAQAGQSIMSGADKGHLHHRMLAMGLNHRSAVIVCYLITLLLSAASLALIQAWSLAALLVALVACLTVFLIGAGKVLKRKKPVGRKSGIKN